MIFYASQTNFNKELIREYSVFLISIARTMVLFFLAWDMVRIAWKSGVSTKMLQLDLGLLAVTRIIFKVFLGEIERLDALRELVFDILLILYVFIPLIWYITCCFSILSFI